MWILGFLVAEEPVSINPSRQTMRNFQIQNFHILNVSSLFEILCWFLRFAMLRPCRCPARRTGWAEWTQVHVSSRSGHRPLCGGTTIAPWILLFEKCMVNGMGGMGMGACPVEKTGFGYTHIFIYLFICIWSTYLCGYTRFVALQLERHVNWFVQLLLCTTQISLFKGWSDQTRCWTAC